MTGNQATGLSPGTDPARWTRPP